MQFKGCYDFLPSQVDVSICILVIGRTVLVQINQVHPTKSFGIITIYFENITITKEYNVYRNLVSYLNPMEIRRANFSTLSKGHGTSTHIYSYMNSPCIPHDDFNGKLYLWIVALVYVSDTRIYNSASCVITEIMHQKGLDFHSKQLDDFSLVFIICRAER